MRTYTSLMVLLNDLTDESAKMVSAVLELWVAESYKQGTPVYYSKVIQGHYLDADDLFVARGERTQQNFFLKEQIATFVWTMTTNDLTKKGVLCENCITKGRKEKFMKSTFKIVAVILAISMLAAFAVACGDDPVDTTQPKDTTPEVTTSENERDLVKDSIPEDLDYSGYTDNTVTFLVRNTADIYKYEICCDDLLNDTLYDAVHYRNIDVENRLGLKIRQIGMSGVWEDRIAFFEALSTCVNTNTSDYDASSAYIPEVANYSLKALFYNMQDLTISSGGGYLELDKPWWNQSLVDECTVYGTLYFLGGDVTITETFGTHLVWFNKDLFNEKFPTETADTLYGLVESGAWTIGKMTDYVSQVWDDVNSSGRIDDGDTVGFKYWQITDSSQLSSWVDAMGIKTLTRDSYGEYRMSDTFEAEVFPAFEAVRTLYMSTGTLIAKETHNTKASDQTTLSNGNLMFVFGYIGDGELYRGASVRYGILPQPKYNEEQDEYANGMWLGSSALVILSHVSPDRASMVSAALEALASESYRTVTPAYCSKVIQGRYSKDEADARMFELALQTCKYTFCTVYNGQLSGIATIFRELYADMQQVLDSKKTVWPAKLDALLDALDAIAVG